MQKIDFQDLPSSTTPLSASNMNAIQTNVENAITEVTNVELLAVSNTAPSECVTGDKYYNTTTKKIYTATSNNTWGSVGEDPISNIFYIVFDESASYSWNGTDLVGIGGGSDLTVHDSYSESTTEPYSANYVNNNSFSGSYNDLSDKPTIPTMDSSYGASTVNGYNKTYINNLNTYDTTERRIGTWGSSALYRKNITGTLNGTYTEGGIRFTWIPSGLSGITVRKMEYAMNTTSSTFAGNSADVSIQYVRTGGNANNVQVGVNNSAIPNTTTITIILYYTKS